MPLPVNPDGETCILLLSCCLQVSVIYLGFRDSGFVPVGAQSVSHHLLLVPCGNSLPRD